MTEDLNKGTGNGSTDSEDSKNKIKEKSENKDISKESDESAISEMVSSLKRFAMADEMETSSVKGKTSAKHDPENKSKKEEHSFHVGNISSQNVIDKLKAKKEKIVRYGALLVGVFLIIYGLVLISASVVRVADNVIFGEKAMLSTFLILLGVLIILAAFAKDILNKTFLNKIHTQLEFAEGRTGSDKDSKKNDENANKVGKDKE